MTTEKETGLRPTQPEPQTVSLGIEAKRIPLHAHVAYFWETDKEFADAVSFLEAGLRGSDRCIIFGHEEANQAVSRILLERGFDIEALKSERRLTLLEGNSSGDMILRSIADAFERAAADGAPLIRLLGNIGWRERNWPNEEDLLAFEARVTEAAKQFPCVVVCMYDLRALSGPIVHHGAFETHPLIIHESSVHLNPYHIPTNVFLKHLESLAADIAERQRAEESLKKSEERFRTLFESASIGISINDIKGRFIQVNKSFQTMLQYSEDELRDISFGDITLSEDLAESKQLFGELVEGKRKEFRVEKRYRKKNGDLLWANTHCSAVYDAGGNFVYTFAMIEDISERKRDERMLREITEGTAAVTGGDFFRLMVQHLASAIQVRYAFVTECVGQQKTIARMLAFWAGDGFAETIEYDVEATPCKMVYEGEICSYAQAVQNLFPEDVSLIELGAESYIGIPMHNSSDEVIGHLVVLDDKPMGEQLRGMSILKIFAARAGAELERLRAEEDLRTALAQVEALKNRLQAENVYLQEEIRREHNFDEIVGSSPALLDALKKVEMVAPTDSTVLVSGETGTGKELIARAIHNRSARVDRPLVKVNCGAISAGLVESELFGHVKGAFTGAIGNRVGRFELADKGTLFLDEVSELPLDTQVKLLRVLQEGEFEPVGSSRTVRVNVRIIAATNRNLEEAIREGRFRQDLFYRLNVFPLQVPPLRERRPDIAQLVSFFLSRFSKKFGKKVNSVSQEAMDLLTNYSWPGNVRELQNIIERGVVLCQGNSLNLDRDLFPAPATGDGSATSESSAFLTIQITGPASSQTPNTLEEVERTHILNVLEQTDWVVEGSKGAAKVLNLHPNTLRSRMKKLGIKRAGHEIS